jgi:hypothetical protein
MPRISSGDRGGRIEGIRDASIDLPDPGGPIISTLDTQDPVIFFAAPLALRLRLLRLKPTLQGVLE